MKRKLNVKLKNNFCECERIKPILKWVGGKSQILDQLIPLFPLEMENYYEIFLGGGSVLLSLLSLVERGDLSINHQIYVSDLNQSIISLYQNIQKSPDELYQCVQQYLSKFKEGSPTDRETYYYQTRTDYNQMSADEKTSLCGSGLFLFLNRTCFRGLYRVGPHGFNVPYGNYQNPHIIDYEHLQSIHHLIRNVQFVCQDFRTSLSLVKQGDFVYLDPPYVPENPHSFVKYTENGFQIHDHLDLFSQLNRAEYRFLLSNADVPLVRDHFQSQQFTIKQLTCRRAINSKNPSSTTGELLIRNY